jgi:hypothetical protein
VAITCVLLSLTVFPYVLKRAWEYFPPVILEPDEWARSRYKEPLSKEQREFVNLEEEWDSTTTISPVWLRVAQGTRNAFCPLDAWHDILASRYYWVMRPQLVTFRTAILTASPWYVHGLCILGQLLATVFFLGWSVSLLRRVKVQSSP